MKKQNKRKRNTRSLTEEEVKRVLETKAKNGWTIKYLSQLSYTSEATVNRFLSGTPISLHCFYSLLKALKLDLQDTVLIKPRESRTNLAMLPDPILNSNENAQPCFIMTGTFTKEKIPQIERILCHLQSLLIGTEVIWGEDNGSIVVSGLFDKAKEAQIKVTLKLLEQQLDSYHITW